MKMAVVLYWIDLQRGVRMQSGYSAPSVGYVTHPETGNPDATADDEDDDGFFALAGIESGSAREWRSFNCTHEVKRSSETS